MHPKKVIAERAHKWEPRGKRMNRASRRRQEKNINTYCHTRWFAVLPARSPLSVNRGRHQQPCSFFFLVSLDRPRGTLQLRHTQRRRLIHETLQNGYEALPLKFFFPSVLTATDASYIFHDHTPKIIIKHSLRRYSHASNTVLSVFKLDREKSRGNAFDEYNNRKHRHLRLIYLR